MDTRAPRFVGQTAAHRYETTYLRHYDRALRTLIDLKTLRKTTTGLDPQAVATAESNNWETEEDDQPIAA